MRALHAATAAAVLLAGCANASMPDEGAGDAGTADEGWGGDGGSADPGSCAGGEHLCDGRCVEDLPNDPELGCALGCGDPCSAPDGAEATCTEGGGCSHVCLAPWEPAEDDTCTCTPMTCEEAGVSCGTADDGCGGELDCGECLPDCMGDGCACTLDEAEANDVQLHAFDLGTMTDRPRTTMALDQWTIHSERDVDWYRATVTDAFGDGNPTIAVHLAGDEAAHYELGAWYVCDHGGDGTSCNQGREDDSSGRGCLSRGSAEGPTVALQTSCGGTDESGSLVIRVMTDAWSGACEPYTLEVDVN